MLLKRLVVAELLGSAFLAMAVVGSGIAATRLTDDVGLQLLINSVVTGAALIALISALSPAAFNPVITLVALVRKDIHIRAALASVGAQVLGCCGGVVLADLMYDERAVAFSHTSRGGFGQLLAEVIATLGLVVIVQRSSSVGVAVGAYIAAAYWFTSSTSFANPALTVARSLTDTFAGIDPSCVPAFVGVQLLGALLALGVVRALEP